MADNTDPTPAGGNPRSEDPPIVPARREPTVPIRLQPDEQGRFNLKKTQLPQSKPKVPKVDPHAVTPQPEELAKQLPPTGGAWMGREETLIGVPSQGQGPVAKEGGPWLGKEETLIPANRRKAAEAGTNQGPWLGNESTLVGMPSESASGGGETESESWLGRESTLVGMPSGGLAGDASTPDSGRGLGKTTATMDDGWHLKGRKGPMTGTNFGDYEVGGILGEGGMGVVYRARQVSLKRRVALKVLPPALAHDVRLRDRFEAEARTASLMNTPHVVQVFSAGTIDDICYFAMEFVEGTDLSEIIKERQDRGEAFTQEEAANYIIQAAKGLAEAGKLGIVHRDIKPANLMVTKKGVVKIADFGISKVAGEHSMTMTGTAVGTPSYCSPEQGRGDPVDPRSDIYSLGVLLYELLAGQKPFEGATANALIYQHNYAEPKLPKELRPELGEEYQAIALKCLQKDPVNRYQEASELVADLERVRAGSAPMTALLSAFGTGADEAMKRLGIKQRKTWPYVLAATLMLGTGGGAYWWWQAGQADRRELAEMRKKLGEAIDASVELDASIPDELAKYANLVGSNDQDLARWRSELQSIQEVESRLAGLDGEEMPGRAVRTQAETDLVAYAGYVGKDGQRYQRWAARLAGLGERESELRTRLTDRMDRGSFLTLAAAEELGPQVATLRVLAGDADPDGQRWNERIEKLHGRVASLRQSLGGLDAADGEIKDAKLTVLTTDLTAFSALLGDQHPDAVRWRGAIASHQAVLDGLRTVLARLDAAAIEGLADLGTIATIEKDLGRYASLATADDPQLKRWTGIVDESRAKVESLRGQLLRLDGEAPVTLVERTALRPPLAEYGRLAGTVDERFQAWNRRLASEEAMIETRTKELERLDDRAHRLTSREITQLRKGVEFLESVGSINAVRSQAARQRIETDAQHIEGLRNAISGHETGDAFHIDKTVGGQVLEFVDLAGLDDPDAKRWRAKAGEFFRLHGALVVLDEALPVPDKAEALLAEYATIVGEDEDVRRWTQKVLRVRFLKAELQVVNTVAPLPDESLAKVDELILLVGPSDTDAGRWRDKILRVNALVTALRARVLEPPVYVIKQDQIAGTAREVRELVSLVGREDEVIDQIALRVALLEGPAKPSWAKQFGRDAYGLHASIFVQGVRVRFRYIPAGTVLIGSPEDEPGRDRDEAEVRMTVSQPVWLAETETTQGVWEAAGFENRSRFQGSEHPVERVSWDDSQSFLLALNQAMPGLNARLPTELEWEYACRCGHSGRWIGFEGKVGGDKLETLGWFGSSSGGATHGVAGRFPNALGIFDMHGNVWEWCQDTYGPYSPAQTTDWVARGGKQRVVRGGSWADQPDSLRAANRLGVDSDMRTLYIGFRIVAPVEWPDQDGFTVLREVKRGVVGHGGEAAAIPETLPGEGIPSTDPASGRRAVPGETPTDEGSGDAFVPVEAIPEPSPAVPGKALVGPEGSKGPGSAVPGQAEAGEPGTLPTKQPVVPKPAKEPGLPPGAGAKPPARPPVLFDPIPPSSVR